MLYLTMTKGGKRANGAPKIYPTIDEKQNRWSRRTDRKRLTTKGTHLLEGSATSGKTKWLMRLHQNHSLIWDKSPCAFLSTRQPIGQWTSIPPFVDYVSTKGKDHQKLKQWEREEFFLLWFNETKPVLLLDDAHLLSGRKMQLAALCVPLARSIVATATAETRIPVHLRLPLQSRNPEIHKLKSAAPADLTRVLMWLLTLVSLGAGAWQVAAALGGLNLLSSGSRSSKQGG
jgi:hypothetical protein